MTGRNRNAVVPALNTPISALEIIDSKFNISRAFHCRPGILFTSALLLGLVLSPAVFPAALYINDSSSSLIMAGSTNILLFEA
jgi:hypothetical protein